MANLKDTIINGALRVIGTIYGTFSGNLTGNVTGTATNATNATNVIVNQHTGNNTNYPVVWTNQTSASTATSNQLYKTAESLYFNTSTFKLTSAGGFIGSLTGNADTATKATNDSDGKAINTTYAKLASPALTGTPTAPTASASTNNTQIATTAYVKSQGYITSYTNYYHTTGSWSGLTYTATANGGAGALAFTIPTGTTATTVAVGNHTHSYLPLSGGKMTGAITFASAQTWPTFNQSTTGNAATATKATQDGSGNTITSTYIKSLSVDGTTITYTKGDGTTTGTITTQDTTYSSMTSSTLGLGKVFSDTTQNVAANSVSSTSSRTYGIQKNSSGQLVVNVPWTNTNTYTSAMCTTSASASGKTATCTNYVLLSNSYIHVIMLYSNTYVGALTLNINGKGATSIYINGNASSSTNYTLPAGSYIVYYDGNAYHFRTDGILPNSSIPRRYTATHTANGINGIQDVALSSQCVLVDMDTTSQCSLELTDSFDTAVSSKYNTNVFLVFECSDAHQGYSCNFCASNNSSRYISIKGMCGRIKGKTITLSNKSISGSNTIFTYSSTETPLVGQFVEDDAKKMMRITSVNTTSNTITLNTIGFTTNSTNVYNWWNIANMCGTSSYTYSVEGGSAFICNLIYTTNGTKRRIHIGGSTYSQKYY